MVLTDFDNLVQRTNVLIALADLLDIETHLQIGGYSTDNTAMMKRYELEERSEELRKEYPDAYRTLEYLIQQNNLELIIESKYRFIETYEAVMEEILKVLAQTPSTIRELYVLMQQYGVHYIKNEMQIACIISEIHIEHAPDSYLYSGPRGHPYWLTPKPGWHCTETGKWSYHE